MSVKQEGFSNFRSDNIRLSPEGDVGGGGSNDKTYTKAELEQIIQGRLASVHEKLEEAKNKNAALEAKVGELGNLESTVSELRSQLDILKGQHKHPEGSNPELEGKMRLMENEHKGAMKQLQDRLERESKARQDAEERRLQVERDGEIRAGLQEAGCRADALEMGLNYFQKRVKFEEDPGRWMYSLMEGGTCKVVEGIAKDLPDYMKDPTLKKGGSGPSSSGATPAKVKQLESEEKKLKDLEKLSQATGKEDDISRYLQQKRKVQALAKDTVRVTA